MRIGLLAIIAAIALSAAPAAVAGPGCAGYKASKVTYPATALEPAAPVTPIPGSAQSGG